MTTVLILCGLLLFTVLTIVTSHRFPLEQHIRHKYNIDREWWIPTLTLLLALSVGVIEVKTLQEVFITKIDIIFLIFTFGVLAEGLAESNVFEYISHTVVEYCNNNTRTLIFGLFIATSAVTLVTTNDIVVLVMTPILIDIAYRANIDNMKLLLLSQFVAANTLSMGLLIGSPTNIIIAETLGIGFLDYAGMMVGVAIVTIIISTLILLSTYELSSRTRFFDSYSLPSTYTTPDFDRPKTTAQMKIWSGIFIGFVILVTIVTELQLSLLWCSIPTIIAAIGYWVISDSHTRTIHQPLKSLPYGVFFFGLTFFTFASAIGGTSSVANTLYPFITGKIQSPLLAIISGIFGSGFLVNVFNDLPAAALIADYLSTTPITTEPLRMVFIQATLIGLNIGAYVTQVGALAGIIWFNQMRVYTKRYDSQSIDLPTRIDLLKYGLLNFLLVGIVMTVLLYAEYLLLT